MTNIYRFQFIMVRVERASISKQIRNRHAGAFRQSMLPMLDHSGIPRVWPFGWDAVGILQWVATLVRGRARTPNGNQPCFRTHGTRYDRAISIYIRALRVVIVRISHAMRARHVGVYASPFLTMQDPYGI